MRPSLFVTLGIGVLISGAVATASARVPEPPVQTTFA